MRMQQIKSKAINASEEDLRQEMLTALHKVRGLCVCCLFISKKLVRNHLVYRCKTGFAFANGIGKFVELMPRMMIPFDQAQRTCFSCYLPTVSFPGYAHADGPRKSDDCHFRHLLKPFLWLSWAHPESRQLVIEHFKPARKGKVLTTDAHWELYYQWCFQRGPKDSMVPNFMFVFLFLYTLTSESINDLP